MNKEDFKRYALAIFQNKYIFYTLPLLASAAIAYFTYIAYLYPLYEEIATIEKNMTMVDEKKLQKELKAKNRELKQLQTRKKELQNEISKIEGNFYTQTYDIVIDIMKKLNNASFNIYEYTLNEKQDEITIFMNGSYFNLIQFYDFIQTIKANIDISGYELTLEEDKLLIKIKMKVGVLKI